MKDLVKVSTYARMHNISVQTVYNKIQEGKLESVKIDGVVFIKISKR